MKYVTYLLWLSLLLNLQNKIIAQSPSTTLSKAHTLVQEGQLDSASLLYEQLLDDGIRNKSQLKNLVIINSQQNNDIKARYYAETLAQHYILSKPWKTKLTDLRYDLEDNGTFATGPIQTFSYGLKKVMGPYIFWILLFVANVLLALSFMTNKTFKKRFFIPAVAILFIALLCILSSRKARAFYLSPGLTEVHYAPDEVSEVTSTLSAGKRVFVIERLGAWLHVSTTDDIAGWVNENNLWKIK